MKKNIELLAPAGSYEALVAAVQNGADAIYLGGNEFSARAFATNFNHDELQEAVKYCHLRNVKVYITVNTLYCDDQFKNLKTYLTFLSTIGVDALIIQDIGLLEFVQKYFPNFEIHMSTQTSICNLEAVKYFEKLGIDRVVLARENTLSEIKDICNNTKLDIEVFVHGALCMSYSGQCLMSSMLAKRSGNKGACGQPCRLAYKLQKDQKNLDTIPSYLLSPKDLCTLENVGKLIESGITSFKIEGRMKRPEYVATIVKKYRDAIDNYLQSKSMNYSTDLLEMKQMFNRGFTGGFLLGDDNFMARDYPGNRGSDVGTVVNYDSKRKMVKIKLSAPLRQGDRIDFNSLEFTRTVTKLFLNKQLVKRAKANDIIEIELNTPVKKNESVYKIIDLDLMEKVQATYQKENIKNNIKMSFYGELYDFPKLRVDYQDKSVTIVSKEIVDEASKSPLSQEQIKKQLSKLGNTVFVAKQIEVVFPENGFFNLKEINQMRRDAIEQLENKLISINEQDISVDDVNIQTHITKTIKGIYARVYTLTQLKALVELDVKEIFFPLNHDFSKAWQIAKEYGKSIIPFTGFMINIKQLNQFKKSSIYQDVSQILVGNYGALEIFNDKKCILDTNFNLYNSYALNYLHRYDAILSLEMSQKQVNNLMSVKQNIIMTVYGKSINMHLRHCVISDHYFKRKKIGCNMCKNGSYCLVDRKGEKFTVIGDDNCNNIIFNSHPLFINKLHELEVDYILLSFSDENGIETKNIYNQFVNILNNKDYKNKINKQYTTSYFYDN